MSAEYTIPALRNTSAQLRNDAAKLVAAAEVQARQHVEEAHLKAAKMCAAADEIDADATAKERQQQNGQGEAVPCVSCGNPLVQDELGSWRHADRAAGSQCRGEAPPAPAPPTAPFDAVPADTRTDGEVAQS